MKNFKISLVLLAILSFNASAQVARTATGSGLELMPTQQNSYTRPGDLGETEDKGAIYKGAISGENGGEHRGYETSQNCNSAMNSGSTVSRVDACEGSASSSFISTITGAGMNAAIGGAGDASCADCFDDAMQAGEATLEEQYAGYYAKAEIAVNSYAESLANQASAAGDYLAAMGGQLVSSAYSTGTNMLTSYVTNQAGTLVSSGLNSICSTCMPVNSAISTAVKTSILSTTSSTGAIPNNVYADANNASIYYVETDKGIVRYDSSTGQSASIQYSGVTAYGD